MMTLDENNLRTKIKNVKKVYHLGNTDQTNQVLPPFLQELKKCLKTKLILTSAIKLIFAIT